MTRCLTARLIIGCSEADFTPHISAFLYYMKSTIYFQTFPSPWFLGADSYHNGLCWRFLPLFCMKNYRHHKSRIYLSGLLSLKCDHIQLALEKKTIEVSGKYYSDDKMVSRVFLPVMQIQNRQERRTL